jgi:hypothetical protein
VVVIAGVHVAVEDDVAVGFDVYVGGTPGGDGEVQGGFDGVGCGRRGGYGRRGR